MGGETSHTLELEELGGFGRVSGQKVEQPTASNPDGSRTPLTTSHSMLR